MTFPTLTSDTTPVCPYFYACGGCDTQDVSYPQQLAAKTVWLHTLFAPLVPEEERWQPIIGSPHPYPIYFRNKIRFGFTHHEGQIWPARHRKGDEQADLPVDRCYLHSAAADQIMNLTAATATRDHWGLYDPHTGRGWFKHLLIRSGKQTGEIMVAAVTTEPPIAHAAAWIEALRQAVPEIVSIYHSTSPGRSVEHLHDELLWGVPRLRERVGEYTFAISPQAFFQTNGEMVHTLYTQVAAAAGQGTALWDLYAGSATLGIFLSQAFREVVSIEQNPNNIADAQINLVENNIQNVEISAGLVENVITSTFITSHTPPDCVLVDPPRAGLHPRLRTMLSHLPLQRLVYVSCNPATCFRDCQALTQAGFRITALQPVDMFPHTYHAELIVTLVR